MTTEEKELWVKVINDARWYDGKPQTLQQLIEHFNNQGIVVKKYSIPNVVGQNEQLVCYTCNCTKGNAPKGDNFCNMCDHYF